MLIYSWSTQNSRSVVVYLRLPFGIRNSKKQAVFILMCSQNSRKIVVYLGLGPGQQNFKINTEVVKTHENVVVYLKLASGEEIKKTSWFHTEVEKSIVFPKKKSGLFICLVFFESWWWNPKNFEKGHCDLRGLDPKSRPRFVCASVAPLLEPPWEPY